MVQITNAKEKKSGGIHKKKKKDFLGYFSMKTVKGKRKISSVETQILMELTTMTAQQYDVSNWGFEKFITRHPQLSGTWRWMLNGGQQTLHVTSYWEFSELNTWKGFLVWVFSSGQRLERRTCFFSVVNISRANLLCWLEQNRWGWENGGVEKP